MPSPYDLTHEQLGDLLEGEPGFRARQVWQGLYGRASRIEEMTELPSRLRERLIGELPGGLVQLARQEADGGDTVKWSWCLRDGARVETVLLCYEDRVSVCISTQAGCAMGCKFCATGQAGFKRHLSTGEILEQVVTALRAARPRRLSHVVFMGMGEPLANCDKVMQAIQRIHNDMGISARRITISTVGVVPGILRVASEGLPVNLALSLHAGHDSLRDQLVPLNRRYPLAALLAACRTWIERTGRRLTLEWALIRDVNDGFADAAELAKIATDLQAHVNLIPLNPTPGFPFAGSSRTRVHRFKDELEDLGVNVTVRSTRGELIDAACGQLAGLSGLSLSERPIPPKARSRL